MIDSALLLPAAVLILWTLVMLAWLALTRLPAASKMGIDIASSVGGRGADLDPQLPPEVAWKSHNYSHLLEQPTLFYAVIALLTLAGATGGLNLALAWAYVGLRIAHSLWQVLVNKVSIRFALFLLSTICLLALSINLLRALL